LLFPVCLSITESENPNIGSSLPLFTVQAAVLITYLAQKNGIAAAAEFQKFPDHPGIVQNFLLGEFQSLGIDFVSLRESIDTSTPTGKMVFTILGAVGELERCTIRERVMAGQKAAKKRGVRFGRPAAEVDTDHVLRLRKQGLSWRAVAEATGVPKDTLIRHAQSES
jgi:hypothetical protein